MCSLFAAGAPESISVQLLNHALSGSEHTLTKTPLFIDVAMCGRKPASGKGAALRPIGFLKHR
jgi:hypothetical protein